MKILICGSRGFEDYKRLETEILKIIKDRKETEVQIIEGGARGADLLGRLFAKRNRYEALTVPAEWDVYGKSAGYRRNEKMLNLMGTQDLVVAFWDGKSKGTQHMIQIAERGRIEVKIIRF